MANENLLLKIDIPEDDSFEPVQYKSLSQKLAEKNIELSETKQALKDAQFSIVALLLVVVLLITFWVIANLAT